MRQVKAGKRDEFQLSSTHVTTNIGSYLGECAPRVAQLVGHQFFLLLSNHDRHSFVEAFLSWIVCSSSTLRSLSLRLYMFRVSSRFRLSRASQANVSTSVISFLAVERNPSLCVHQCALFLGCRGEVRDSLSAELPPIRSVGPAPPDCCCRLRSNCAKLALGGSGDFPIMPVTPEICQE